MWLQGEAVNKRAEMESGAASRGLALAMQQEAHSMAPVEFNPFKCFAHGSPILLDFLTRVIYHPSV